MYSRFAGGFLETFFPGNAVTFEKIGRWYFQGLGSLKQLGGTSMEAVALNPGYRNQPHRADLVAITSYGRGLPISVQRQFAIQEMLSDELASAITGLKPTDQALSDAEHRINDMLTNLS